MKYFFLFCFLTIFGFSEEIPEKRNFPTIALSNEPKAGYLSFAKDQSIDVATYLYVKYALEEFRKQKVDFILLDLDSPGGEVFSALRIVEELRKVDLEDKIPVVALVDNWALSAGAMLAYSCRYIGATNLASMGAAEPVLARSDGTMESASEKMVSALRVEFSKAAELYGRDPLVAEAMVDKDKVLVMREGKITSLLEDSQILPEDHIITTKGKLLTLDAKQMMDLKVADFMVPSLGILNGQKALIQESFFDKEIRWVSYSNWKISFFAFLSRPLVSSLLMLGLMIGLYGAIQNPGLGFSALLGITCLFFILLSSFATQLVGVLEVIIFLLGLLILLIDIVFLGSGILSGIGLVFFLGGLIAILLPALDWNSFSWDPSRWGIALEEWSFRLSLFLTVVLLGLIACLFLSRFWLKKSFFMKKLILQDRVEEDVVEKMPILGREGTAFTSLRPFGKVLIGGKIYEAESESDFITAASKIIVVDSSKPTLRVKEKI